MKATSYRRKLLAFGSWLLAQNDYAAGIFLIFPERADSIFMMLSIAKLKLAYSSFLRKPRSLANRRW